jgi:hypothetical protein
MRVFDLSMVRVRAVGPSSVGGEHYPESVVVEVFEAVGEAADFFDDQVDGFGAAVGDAVGGVEVASSCCRQLRRVRPSRATSAIGQEEKLSSTF